jgi:hypothetical protein
MGNAMTTPPRPPSEDPPGGETAKDARGRAVWEWAADSARLVALTATQVLRKLEHKGLSLEDDSKGSQSKSQGGTGGAGGGFNPYDRKLPARGTRTPTAPRGAGAPRKAPSARSPGSAPVRSSWWRRLFGRG